MPIDIISPQAVISSLRGQSKKQILQELAERAAQLANLPEREVFDAIIRREKLGSTGVGNGVAIPHGKLKELNRILGVFGRASRPVDFEALDDEPVDLVFLLLAPEDSGADHLKSLSRVARLLRNPDAVKALRSAPDAAALYDIISHN
ncbi:PTS IIA-like nitrogen regulatory protein PtsN [Aureimonas fodinaquatilis]|uniref:PTS IIA-like nitrogen regulatory protein PtsN n=1 Tax=Aureimonas fodinaquatilis TaxID=2565783 RepID=A0A5B0DS09_9HYPH|nr:PTS IIA-like nitrogen regulatory protein PtsN [Aureimonas fodinaquatilis]KAA0968541.1 PTS IIA-like nitrogen regulatory protein PtsN [Aureimonas fodinaquatilis]